MLVHPTHMVLSSATLSNEIFYCLSLSENLVVCVPSTTAKQILFSNHRNRSVVGGKHNLLVYHLDASALNPYSDVLCNTFKYSFVIYWQLLRGTLKGNTLECSTDNKAENQNQLIKYQKNEIERVCTPQPPRKTQVTDKLQRSSSGSKHPTLLLVQLAQTYNTTFKTNKHTVKINIQSTQVKSNQIKCWT